MDPNIHHQHQSQHDHQANHQQKDFLTSFFPATPPGMQQDHHLHPSQGAGSLNFPPTSSPSSTSQTHTTPLSSVPNLQSQLTLNMLGNMMQIQNVGDQLVGMAGQQAQTSGATGVQYNPQALLEHQFKLAQLQQLQQLQNQIFQQQIALISGQPFLSSSPSMSRQDLLSSGLSLQSMKDSGPSTSTHTGPVSSFAGLPTPGPSSEIRPRDTPMEFVSPMILNPHSFLDSPISSQSTSHSQHHNDHPFPHSHHQHPSSHPPHSHHFPPHSHAHTAPPQIAFHIQSSIPSHEHGHGPPPGRGGTSPVFGGDPDAPPSSTLSTVSAVTGTDLDLDISPITSPWLGAAGHQQHQQHQQQQQQQPGASDGAGMMLHHSRSASLSHHPSSSSSMRAKRPAEGSGGNDVGDQSGGATTASSFESSEPLRKKQSISLSQSSPNTMRGMNHPPSQHPHHLTPHTLLPQDSASSPIMSPTSPLSIGLGSATGPATAGTSAGTGGRGTYRGSKSVSNTPLLRGQRTRMDSITRAQANNNYNISATTNNANLSHQHHFGSGGNNSSNNGGGGGSGSNASNSGSTPSSAVLGATIGMTMMGMEVGDTPSPVDLNLSMPPPAPPDHANSGGVGAAPGGGAKLGSNSSSSGSGGNKPSAGIVLGLGEERLLPVTPASIMKLGRLGVGGAAGPSPGHRHSQAQSSQDKNVSEANKDNKEATVGKAARERGKEGEKGGERERERVKSSVSAGGAPNAGAVGGRTRRATLAAAAANVPIAPANSALGVGAGLGLKAILPANTLESGSGASASNNHGAASHQPQQPRKTSHKAAEQKRRDSLKTTFDDLRTLLPLIPLPSDIDDTTNTGVPGIPGAWPPRSSSNLPGSLPPRGPPKTGVEGPNKGVSKLQLLICGNEYIRVLKSRVERRDEEIGRLRREVGRLRELVRSMRLGEEGPGSGGGGEGDVEMADFGEGLEFGLDLDLDLERDLDAVEGMQGMQGGGGAGQGSGECVSVSVLESVGEQDEEGDRCG